MNATGNKRTYRSVILQLVVIGLVMVAIGGCRSNNEQQVKVMAAGPGSDTPIVISGGSIHFRARKRNPWQTCDGNPPTSRTTCYMAPFNHTVKATVNYYQFLDSNFGLDKRQASTTGWEVDVVDTNPGNQSGQPMLSGVKVCAESSSPFTSCNFTPFATDFIYVIAVGGAFAPPSSAHPRKLVYDDVVGTNDYDSINDIRLNVSSNGSTWSVDEACTAEDNYCAWFLSK